MSTQSLSRRISSFSVRHTRTTVTIAAFLLVAIVILIGKASKAANPTNDTLNPTTGTSVSWNGTAAGGSSPQGESTCVEGVNCDTFTLNVGGTPAAWAGKMIFIKIVWTVPSNDYDLYVHKTSNAGPLIGSSGGGAPGTSEQVTIQPSVSGTGIYTVHVVYFTVTPDQYHGTAIVLATSPRPAPPGSGPAAGYVNYPAPGGLGTDSGEPSIGVNWNSEAFHVSDGGTAMFEAGLQTLRVKFNDNTAPATDSWEDVSSPFTSLVSLDPILFTDPRTGRTFVSQLTGQDSLSAYTDDDGNNWIPSQGGGIPSGVDHQTIGGGRYAGDLAAIPHPAYANAVYYCSQDLVTAFCARSDDGGLTYGAGIPTYISECGGIHGHVKVSPVDGTVYTPNHTCGNNQGVAVSEDNGITWTVHRVIAGNGLDFGANSSPADWDPSVGIGSLGTVYFGYKNGDGTAHMAISRDHGKTWVRDYDVGAVFGIKTIAFPAVVAGDDDRAAFAFLGTTGLPNPSSQIWHLYVAHTYDRGASYITTDLTPNDPVQVGGICSAGISCGSDRNLLDFIDVTIDKEGRVLVGYADGCLGCTNATSTQSTSALATIARECSGRGLFAQFDSLLASSSCGGPGPSPTPPPSNDSCDGINVITDPSKDASNPAPGGQGPTDQADITAVSFSANATTLTTSMRIFDLSQTPSPGTTFTSYYVVWTSSDGIQYGTEVDVDAATISYYWGTWDSSNNQLSTFNAVTGTFTPGPNGTITVPVPRSGIGNPTIPITDPSQTAAVTNPFAYTVAGEGVLGAGLVFTAFMDRAPNGGSGKRWAVCPANGTPTPTPTVTPTPPPSPTPTPTPVNCTPPGLQILTDPANDQVGNQAMANQQLDIRSVSIAEQYPGGVGKLVFTMKVSQLTPAALPPNANWRTYFTVRTPNNTTTTYFVTVGTNTTANPTGAAFQYGFVDVTTNNLNRTVGLADGGTVDGTNQTLTVTLALSKIKEPTGTTLGGPVADLSAGRVITAVNGVTSQLVGVVGSGLLITVDSTSQANYQMVGPAACQLAQNRGDGSADFKSTLALIGPRPVGSRFAGPEADARMRVGNAMHSLAAALPRPFVLMSNSRHGPNTTIT